MSCQIFIKRGKAILTPSGLRCQGPRPKDQALVCNKLLVRKNSAGSVAGEFKCDRCGQVIEVMLGTPSG